MDYKFLHRVVDQLVSETRIDYNYRMIHAPFSSQFPFSVTTSRPYLFSMSNFFLHCRDIYGLNDQEIEYIWKRYYKIIKDKIKNG